jgi:type III restriction enzyme
MKKPRNKTRYNNYFSQRPKLKQKILLLTLILKEFQFLRNRIVPNTTVSEIEKSAIEQNEAFEKTVSEMEANNTTALPNEIQQLVKTYSIKDIFQEQAGQINLPQFYLKVPANDLFGKKEEELPLEKENLLDGFALSKADTNIAFDSITAELYKVDLDETKKNIRQHL